MSTRYQLGMSGRNNRRIIKLGESGIGSITLFDTANFPGWITGEINNFDQFSYLPYNYPRRFNRVEQLNSAASIEAMKQAGLNVNEINPGSFGVIVSSAIGGINSLQDIFYTPNFESPRKINPDVIPNLMINGSSAIIAVKIWI